MAELQNIRVLVAEDDFLACENIKALVEDIGFTVVGEAIDGLEAVAQTKKLQPDIVIMDVKMPYLDGLAATQRIQTECPTPVVILTAFQTPELIARASQMGVAAYLIKPPNIGELARTITIALARFADLNKLRQMNEQLQSEIKERERLAAELQTSVDKNQMLLREVHHRVKNNLSIISSLLYLQSTYVTDELARAALQESQDRIKSMARIHQQLYEMGDLSQIDLEQYVQDLAASLKRSYRMGQIHLELTVTNAKVPIALAIPCGLITNELVTNAIKHAFPNGQPGVITIELDYAPAGSLHLVIRDNGVGLPANFDLQKVTSLGLQLVKILTEQHQGTFKISPTSTDPDRPGVRIELLLPTPTQ